MNFKGIVNIKNLDITANQVGSLKILNQSSKEKNYILFWDKDPSDNYILKFKNKNTDKSLEKYISSIDLHTIVSVFLMKGLDNVEVTNNDIMIDLHNWELP